jgi:branched-chain amino acid transport system substrate-binding protein
MRFRNVAIAAVLAALVPSVAACGSSKTTSSPASGSKSGGTFNVLYIGDLSGPTKVYGESDLQGVQAGSRYVNAHGGINGTKISITQANDNGDAATAVSQFLKYVSTHSNPDEVFMGSESGETAALLPVLAQHKVLAFSSQDGNSELVSGSQKYPYQFSTTTLRGVAGQGAAQWFKKKGITKVGLLAEQIDYDQSGTPFVQAALKAQGISSTVVNFPATATSLTSQVNQLQSAGAQAVYFEGIGPAAGYALAGRNQLHWTAPFVTDPAASTIDLTTLVSKAQLSGVSEQVNLTNDGSQSLPGVAELKSNLKAIGDTSNNLLSIPGFEWDFQIILSQAAKQAKSTSAAALSKALENLSSSAQSDPLYVTAHKIGFTASTHDNAKATINDFPVIGAGPVVGGQVHPYQ